MYTKCMASFLLFGAMSGQLLQVKADVGLYVEANASSIYKACRTCFPIGEDVPNSGTFEMLPVYALGGARAEAHRRADERSGARGNAAASVSSAIISIDSTTSPVRGFIFSAAAIAKADLHVPDEPAYVTDSRASANSYGLAYFPLVNNPGRDDAILFNYKIVAAVMGSGGGDVSTSVGAAGPFFGEQIISQTGKANLTYFESGFSFYGAEAVVGSIGGDLSLSDSRFSGISGYVQLTRVLPTSSSQTAGGELEEQIGFGDSPDLPLIYLPKDDQTGFNAILPVLSDAPIYAAPLEPLADAPVERVTFRAIDGSPAFSSFILPESPTSGADELLLHVGSSEVPLQWGDTLDFLEIDPNGIREFSLSTDELSSNLTQRFTHGFTFTSQGTAAIEVELLRVPEPSCLILLGMLPFTLINASRCNVHH